MSGTPNRKLPEGWVQSGELGTVAFVHEPTGFEVMETIHGYRVFRRDGSSIPGTHRSVRAAMKAAEERMR